MNRPPGSRSFDHASAERFMRRAIELGRQGMTAGNGGPFGAVVVRGDEILGEGWNRVVATNDPTAHGEIVAIRAACQRTGSFSLQGCDLYTSGEPCPMCLAAIYWSRVERVFYGFSIEAAASIGFDDRVIYEQIASPPGDRTIAAVQILSDEALEVLTTYAADPTRVRY